MHIRSPIWTHKGGTSLLVPKIQEYIQWHVIIMQPESHTYASRLNMQTMNNVWQISNDLPVNAYESRPDIRFILNAWPCLVNDDTDEHQVSSSLQYVQLIMFQGTFLACLVSGIAFFWPSNHKSSSTLCKGRVNIDPLGFHLPHLWHKEALKW